MAYRVDFTDEDIGYAHALGAHIRQVSCELSLKEKSVVAGGVYDPHQDFIGVLGEMALARFLNTPFIPNICTFKRPDVLGYQSRATDAFRGGCMPLRPGDNPDHAYVLTTLDLEMKRGFVRGWIWGYEGMVDENWYEGDDMARRLRPGDPAWLIEQYQLYGLETLPNVDRAAAE